MNGRVYDPELGRFLSADPHVQSPRASQSYNRYSYVLNNPIRYADPSGYFFEELGEFFQTDLGKVVGIGLAIWGGFAAYQAASSAAMMGASGACLAPWAPSVVFAGTVAGGAAMGAINGAVAGVSQTGTFEGFLTGAAKGGALGAAGGALGAWFGPGTAGRMFGGGLNGAFMTGDIEGFGRGMLSGLVPADLGIDAFYSNAWANTGINILRDGIRGAIIDGSDGARRSINAGLFNNAVGHLYGFIASGGKGFLGFSSLLK